MGAKRFDLIESISDLLRRIEEGRKTVREAQSVKDSFWSAHANRVRADQLMQAQALRAKVEPAGSQAMAELDRQLAERQKLADESGDLWRQFNETMSFIGPFHEDVLLLLERLPLKPEWDGYRKALGSLKVSLHGSWTDPPDNSALGTLEMRLQEMLDLATRTQRGKFRRFDPFPTPEGTTWRDVSITFTSEHRVQISVLSVKDSRSFAEMGFEDRRGGAGKPDSAWECLKLLAKSAGRIERTVNFNRPGWTKVEKQIQAIRARLKDLFGIPGDPLPFRKRNGYEAQFQIKLGNSIKH